MVERVTDRATVRVQRDALSVDEARRYVQEGNVGAISIFIGTTRSHTEGKGQTSRLEYECYEEMAVTEMIRLCTEARHRWEIERVFIAHRVGGVPVGEASVVIAASAAHRRAAMESCQYLIDTLKRSVPIWKKELYADGSTEWVRGALPNQSS